MSVTLMVIIALLVFFICLAAELPVAVGLTAGGAVGLFLYGDWGQMAATVQGSAYQNVSTYTLVVIPMFILMGVLVANAGVLTDLFNLAAKLTRRLPGGVGIATVMSAAGFAAVTGSSAAAVATLGKFCVAEMERHGYLRRFAAGIVAAAGTLGILIPPSIVLVIYGVLTFESISRLLLGAIIPGILTAIAYALTIVVLALVSRRKLARVPSSKVSEPAAASVSAGGAPTVGSGGAGVGTTSIQLNDATDGVSTVVAGRSGGLPQQLEAVFYIGLVVVVVLGGIYGGVFTETEAGAFGALVALIILLLRSGRTEMGLRRSLVSALRETSAVTSMIFALLIGGGVFTLFLVTARVPNSLTEWIIGMDMSPYMVLFLILLLLLVLGALLDGVSILLLTMPITYPLITSLGFDGIWYGIIAIKMVEIGLLTPPFGLNVYMVAGVSRTKVEEVFRGVFPFIITELVVVGVLVAFPELVTWLPDMSQR
jgi:TRAP-type C4-dicarboxylate transport system permease large subunit